MKQIMSDIFRSGCSRIPIYDKDRNDIVGIILSKDLICIDPEDCIPIQIFLNVFGRSLVMVWPDQKLGEVLKLFRQKGKHLAIVRDVNSSDPTVRFYLIYNLYGYHGLYTLLTCLFFAKG